MRADTGKRERYRLKLPMGKEREPWKTRIVMSSLPEAQLPHSMRRDGVREVCAVEAVLNPYDMKRKNKHWYNLGREYNRAEFEIRMLVGAGLRFEIWGEDGDRSRGHNEIEVKWENGESKLSPTQGLEEGLGIYRI